MPDRDRPIRVLHVVASLGVGGIERWVEQIASAIDRRRVHLDVLVHDAATGALEAAIQQAGSAILRCPPPGRPVAWRRAFVRHLDAGGYDAVHAHPYRFCGPILRVAHRCGVPVRIAHSRNALPIPPWTRPHARLIDLAAKRLICRHLTHGLAVSSPAAAALFGPDWRDDPRIQRMPSAIDLDLFRGLPRPAPTRRDLGIADDALVVGHCGGFRPAKNHARLLDLFASLHRRRPASALVLIGDGPLRDAIDRDIDRRGLGGVVHRLGHQDDVPAVFDRLCDVCVLPSRWEGLPRVVGEAIGVGLPAVIAEHLAPELDYVPGRVWRVSLSASDAAWAAAIDRAGHAGRMDRGRAIAALVEAGLDVAGQAARLATLYERAVAG
jgi:glycosyltransferase involved in cell wall biosynthesis